ncbi:MAG: restriction endonuclease subunit S [Prevotella sp.]|nr:restriction endonuclease subunit S [Prevotella sp.]
MREGWEYKKFENCIVKSPKLKQVKKEAYNNGSQYPIISQEEKFISGYCDDESMVCHIDRPIVVFGDHTRVLKYIDFDFVVGADGVKVIIPIKSIDSKFLLYFLQWYNIPNLGYSRHYKLLKDVMVPIPNCTTQQTIISELDKLNELIQIKKEQLKAYDALAQSIFYEMFGDPVENEKGWEVKKLGEVSIYPKERVAINQICSSQYVGVENLIKDRGGVRFSDNLPKADVAIAYKENDILLGNIRPYLKKIWLADKVGGASGDVVIIRIKERSISPLFLFKLLSSDQFFEYDNTHTKGAKMPRGDRKAIEKFGVILPPLPLQHSFAQKIEQIEQQKAAIQKTITDLETLLAARMQYWFD